MPSPSYHQFSADMTSLIRDLRLHSVADDRLITCHPPSRGLLSFLYRGHRMIDKLSDMGGIVTGSRALSMYRVAGRPVIDRKPADWDVVLDRQSFYRFCADTGAKFDYLKDNMLRVGIKAGYCLGRSIYGDTWVMDHDIDVFCRDSMPPFITCGCFRVATLDSVMAEKVRMINDGEDREDKHIRDCMSVLSVVRGYAPEPAT